LEYRRCSLLPNLPIFLNRLDLPLPPRRVPRVVPLRNRALLKRPVREMGSESVKTAAHYGFRRINPVV
jgi:hypothetical protein